MRVRVASWLLLVLLLSAGSAWSLEVAEAVVTTEVSDRAPVDEVLVLPAATVGKLYCFTRVTGAGGESAIYHVWYRQGLEVRRARLTVRSDDWRTWSVQPIQPDWTGEWKVDVLDAQGQSLRTLDFRLN